MSEKAILSGEAGSHSILNLTIKYSVLVMRQGVIFQLICINYARQGGDL